MSEDPRSGRVTAAAAHPPPLVRTNVADSSEEKTEPASEKKLRDARRKGQVPHSKDFVSSMVFLAAAGYLLSSWTGLDERLRQLIDIAAAASAEPFADVAERAGKLVGIILVQTLATLGGITAAAAVLSGVAATFGPVFALEALQPKLEHISPAKGLKRIFGGRSWIEFAKSLVKIAILAPACWLVFRSLFPVLVETPECGTLCFASVLLSGLELLAGTAAIIFVAIGLVDLLVQRQLFLREMRMSQTELKREYKDMEGDPHVRGELRRLRRELASSVKKLGLQNAVIGVTGVNHFVGLRYKQGETTIPYLVCKGRDDAAARMNAEARRRAISLVNDSALAAALLSHSVGQPIKPDLFDSVARLLISAGIGREQ
jgi:type III secretion protein U